MGTVSSSNVKHSAAVVRLQDDREDNYMHSQGKPGDEAYVKNDQFHQMLKYKQKPIVERWTSAAKKLNKAEPTRQKEELAHEIALRTHELHGTPPPHLPRPHSNPFHGAAPFPHSPIRSPSFNGDFDSFAYRDVVGSEPLHQSRKPLTRSQSGPSPSRDSRGAKHEELSRSLHRKDAEIRRKMIEYNKGIFDRAYRMEGQGVVRKHDPNEPLLFERERAEYRNSDRGRKPHRGTQEYLEHVVKADHKMEAERREIERTKRPRTLIASELRRTQSVPRPPGPYTEDVWRGMLLKVACFAGYSALSIVDFYSSTSEAEPETCGFVPVRQRSTSRCHRYAVEIIQVAGQQATGAGATDCETTKGCVEVVSASVPAC